MCSPEALSRSTSSGSSATPGCGRSRLRRVTGPSRSRPSIRVSSAMASCPVSCTARRGSRARSGDPSRNASETPAWTTITLTQCATMSWSSRAIRLRSAASAAATSASWSASRRRARSASSCARSSRCLSTRPAIISPAAGTTANGMLPAARRRHPHHHDRDRAHDDDRADQGGPSAAPPGDRVRRDQERDEVPPQREGQGAEELGQRDRTGDHAEGREGPASPPRERERRDRDDDAAAKAARRAWSCRG